MSERELLFPPINLGRLGKLIYSFGRKAQTIEYRIDEEHYHDARRDFELECGRLSAPNWLVQFVKDCNGDYCMMAERNSNLYAQLLSITSSEVCGINSIYIPFTSDLSIKFADFAIAICSSSSVTVFSMGGYHAMGISRISGQIVWIPIETRYCTLGKFNIMRQVESPPTIRVESESIKFHCKYHDEDCSGVIIL